MTGFDIVSDLGTLDELIQVIYQGANKFIVLSNVADDGWYVHLTLANTEGRWWTGKWNKENVIGFLGSDTSAEAIERFAENPAESITKGELHVGNWSSAKGAELNLTFGVTSKKPVQITLSEMEPIEAARYATKMFALIASYAQDRKCRLYPSSYEVSTSNSDTTFASISNAPEHSTMSSAAAKPGTGSSRTGEAKTSTSTKASNFLPAEKSASSTRKSAAEEEVTKLKAELAREKKKASARSGTTEEHPLLKSQAKTNSTGKRQMKGASLANPNKKARTVQALEFEDSD